MSLSSLVDEWVAAYEQETGRKPTEAAVRMAEHITNVWEKLREAGIKDAQEGRTTYRPEAFHELVCSVFQMDTAEDPVFVEGIAELWQDAYTKGYRKGGEANV